MNIDRHIDDAPKKLYQISHTQLSIARHYGGCKFNGHNYIYNPKDDTLTREDVWKEEWKKKKLIDKKAAKAWKEKRVRDEKQLL